MSISFVGKGTGAAAGSGNVSPSLAGIGIQAGDVAFIVVSNDDNNTPTFPSGWDTIDSRSVSFTQGTLAWKRLTGSETTILVTHSGNAVAANMVVYRGCISAGDPWRTKSVRENDHAGSTITASSITPHINDLVVFFGTLDDSGSASQYSGSDPSLTERMDYSGSGWASVCAADGLSTTGHATGTRTAQSTGSGPGVGWLLALIPQTEEAPAPPPPDEEAPPVPGAPEVSPRPALGSGMVPAIWKFILAESNGLTPIGELSRAHARQLTLVLNRSGSFTFTLSLTDKMAFSIEPLQTCLIAVRNNAIVWSGPIWTIEEDVVQGKMTVTATGWAELLFHRYIPHDNYTWAGASVDAGQIAQGLLTLANDDYPTKILNGTTEVTQPRQRTYLRGSNVGQEIVVLSDIEAGYDFQVHPETRKLNIYDSFGEDKSDVAHFVYGRNVTQFKRTLDASYIANRVTTIGPYGAGLHDDAASIAAYGLQEDYISLADVPDPEILAAYAAIEVALRRTPKATYGIQPRPTGYRSVPRSFDDYNLGDTVLISAKRGRVNIQGQGVRIFSMTIDVDDNGVEKMGEIRVAS